MSKAFDMIMQGLDDARRFIDGEREGFVAHEVAVAEPDEHGDEDAESRR
ncbi:hypothetical protein [Candidatus Poriferisodalis sp.]